MALQVLPIRLSVLFAAGLTAIACGGDPDQAKLKHLSAGDALVADKNYAAAIIEYRNAIQQDPNFGEARSKLADTYDASGRTGEALPEYVRAADLLPDNLDAQVKAASSLLLSGQFQDAKSRAQRVLDRDPKHVQAQILLGSAMAGLRDFGSAVSQLEDAVTADPGNGLTYSNLANVKLAAGDKEAARLAFEKAVAIEPRNVLAWLSLAQFRLAFGESGQAEEALRMAWAVDSTHELTNRALATFYLASGRAADAEPHLKMLAEKTGDPEFRFKLADSYVVTQRPKDAQAILLPMAAQPSTFAGAQTRLAHVEYRSGNTGRAYQMVDEVLVKEPNNSSALLLKAQWLFAERKPTEALARTAAAIKADPNNVGAHYLHGTILQATRDFNGAIAAFTEVLRLNPQMTGAQLHLSRLQLGRGGDGALAVQMAQASQDDVARGFATRVTLARALVVKQDLSRAQAAVDELLKEYSLEAIVHDTHGMLRWAMNDRAGARQAYEKALQLSPGLMTALAGLTSIDLIEQKTAVARTRIEGYLTKFPDNPAVLMLAGRTYTAARDYGKAEQAFKRVIVLTPADNDAYALLAQTYFFAGKLDQAQAEFDEVGRRDPKDVSARTMAASILHAQEKTAEAKTRYQAIVESDPDAAVAANNLAWILAEEGTELDQAQRLAQRAVDRAPQQPQMHDTLGWVYVKKQLPALAIGPFQRSVALDPTNPTYHLHLGLAYAGSGDALQARRSADAALKLDPSLAEAQQFRKSLGR